MIDQLSEIPLPGRMLAPAAAPTGDQPLSSTSLGFITGAENRLVASTVNRLMTVFATAAGPKLLALFGPTGTGKTHLVQGLVNHWNAHRADSAVYYTAGDFYRGLLDAIKRHAMADFHATLRQYQLLAIDDLHQLPADDYVSRELRFTLDAFEETGGTIIVASPRPAHVLSNISLDVRSRLSAALSLQLAPPAGDTRIRIIRRAAESLGRPLSDETAAQLATNVDGNANDLFGAVFEFCAKVDDNASVPSRYTRQPQFREIIAAVARHFGLSQKDLKSQSRKQSIVTARAVAIFLARELSDASYEQIGRALGGRDHTTIIHSYRKIERARLQDPTIQEAIGQVTRAIRTR